MHSLESTESPNLNGANQTFLDFWTLSQERKEDEKERCRGGLAGPIKVQTALKVRRDPQKIPSTKCPIGTLNLAPFVWMCLISHGPVISASAGDWKFRREQGFNPLKESGRIGPLGTGPRRFSGKDRNYNRSIMRWAKRSRSEPKLSCERFSFWGKLGNGAEDRT